MQTFLKQDFAMEGVLNIVYLSKKISFNGFVVNLIHANTNGPHEKLLSLIYPTFDLSK